VLPLAPQIQENTIATLIIFLTRRHASLIVAQGRAPHMLRPGKRHVSDIGQKLTQKKTPLRMFSFVLPLAPHEWAWLSSVDDKLV
jgi:hypothetical protein